MEKILLQVFEEFTHFKASLKRDSAVFRKCRSVLSQNFGECNPGTNIQKFIVSILTYVDMYEILSKSLNR